MRTETSIATNVYSSEIVSYLYEFPPVPNWNFPVKDEKLLADHEPCLLAITVAPFVNLPPEIWSTVSLFALSCTLFTLVFDNPRGIFELRLYLSYFVLTWRTKSLPFPTTAVLLCGTNCKKRFGRVGLGFIWNCGNLT